MKMSLSYDPVLDRENSNFMSSKFLRFSGFLVLMCWLIVMPVQATPSLSLLAGERETGTYKFAEDLARLWNWPAFGMQYDLTPMAEPSPQSRVERLRSRQGDFAILDAESAYRYLSKQSEVRVISVLWPNVLHVISRTQEIDRLQVETDNSILLHENSAYLVEAWGSLVSLTNFQPEQFHWYAGERSSELLSSSEHDIMVLTAPFPLPQVQTLLQAEARMLPLDPLLSQTLQKKHPWLRNQAFPKNVYNGVSNSMRFLMKFPVLVTRADLDDALVQASLTLLFTQTSAVQPHPLFRFLDKTNNRLFKEAYLYHRAAKKSLGL